MLNGMLRRIRLSWAWAANDAAGKGQAPLSQTAMATSAVPLTARFHLVRHVTVASLGIFALVALALVLQGTEQTRNLMKDLENQAKFFGEAQSGFAKQQETAAYRDLLTAYDSGHRNLTQIFANVLWKREFAPFVGKAQAAPVEQCRVFPDTHDKDGRAVPGPEKKACFAEVGRKIRALPEFKGVDARVVDITRRSTVHKIKVYDLRGITVYSSEHSQIGEDKATNAGFRSAASGKVISDLSHRDRFNAFEGVIENRDLISSYLPVFASREDKVIAVLEVYSDVTPMLDQIKSTSALIKNTATENMSRVERAMGESEKRAEREAAFGVAVIFALLALLFVALHFIVRRAAGIVARQEDVREQQQRQLVQSEKMAALGQMIAGVAHQLNTPLAFSQSNVNLVMEQLDSMRTAVRIASKFSEIVKRTPGESVVINLAGARQYVESVQSSTENISTMRDMLQDVLDGIDQMSELVLHMRNFTRVDRNKVAMYDVNRGLQSVVYLARSVMPCRITIVEQYGDIPQILCHASQLNQVFLNLVNNAAQAIPEDGTVTVSSKVEGTFIQISVSDTGLGIPPEVLPHIFEAYFTTKPESEGTGLGLTIAMEVARNHGGDIKVITEPDKGASFCVYLPIAAEPAMANAA